ncbi:putative reverse transcriptase domain-containing protein, partial [Tanacetum coccineum]
MTMDNVTFQTNNVVVNFNYPPNVPAYKPIMKFLLNCPLNKAFTNCPSVVYQNFLREFWSTAVAYDPFPSTDETEQRPLREFLIKFSVLNGQRPLTLDFNTFCSSTGLDYNNGKYVAPPTPKAVKKELGKIAINSSYLDKTLDLKNSFPVAWRILFTFVIQISKKARILKLKRRNMKITVLTTNTLYPSRKIRHICACTSLKTTKETRSIRRLRKKYRLSLKNDMPPRDKTKAIYGRKPKQIYGESAKRHEENSNLIKEIRALTDAAIRYQGESIKTLEIQIGQISKVLQEREFGSLPSSTETNPRDHVKSISTIVEADASSIRRIGSHQYAVSIEQNKTLMYETKQTIIPFSGARVSNMPLSTYLNLGFGELAHTKLIVELANRTVKYPKGIAENMLLRIGKFVFPIDFIILDMPEDVKVPLILGRPFLSTAHAKIDVFKRKITLRVGEEKIIFKSIKPASSLIKRVYMLSLREIIELDLEARLMGETLVLNRSLDPFFEDYIELNDLNVPLELRRDQVDDLMPTIKGCEVIKEVEARNDARM